jgi:hypothetical protein
MGTQWSLSQNLASVAFPESIGELSASEVECMDGAIPLAVDNRHHNAILGWLRMVGGYLVLIVVAENESSAKQK